MKYALTVDGAIVTKQVQRIVLMNKKGHEALDVVARNCILQAIMHRNTTPLVQLVTGLDGTSIHVAGLIKWAISYGPVKYSRGKDKAGKMAHNFKMDDDKHAKCDRTKAVSEVSAYPTFWSFAPPPKFKPFDLKQALNQVLKQAEKYDEAKRTGLLGDMELTPEEQEKIDTDGLKYVQNFVNNLGKNKTENEIVQVH